MKEKILIVEDEARIAHFIRTVLSAHDYESLLASTGKEALSLMNAYCPDLMILDLGLPDIDGLEIIRSARSWTQLPILVVSARMNEHDKVEALDAGADDYITKPFGTGELLARIRTALRHIRRNADSGSIPESGLFQVGRLTIDYNKHWVLMDGKNAHLTQNEYKIVSLLGMHAGKVLTYDFILRTLWGPGVSNDNQVLRVHMAHIRRKIEENPAQPRYIFTEVGVGYRIADEAPDGDE